MWRKLVSHARSREGSPPQARLQRTAFTGTYTASSRTEVKRSVDEVAWRWLCSMFPEKEVRRKLACRGQPSLERIRRLAALRRSEA